MVDSHIVSKDKAAICLSFLCALHCVLAPFAVLGAGLGFVSWFADSEWLHYVLFASMVLLMCLLAIKNIATLERLCLRYAALDFLFLGYPFTHCPAQSDQSQEVSC